MRSVAQCIATWHNRFRRHSALGYRIPQEAYEGYPVSIEAAQTPIQPIPVPEFRGAAQKAVTLAEWSTQLLALIFSYGTRLSTPSLPAEKPKPRFGASIYRCQPPAVATDERDMVHGLPVPPRPGTSK